MTTPATASEPAAGDTAPAATPPAPEPTLALAAPDPAIAEDEVEDPPCLDMAVVMTSQGNAEIECKTKRPDSGVRTKSWREN